MEMSGLCNRNVKFSWLLQACDSDCICLLMQYDMTIIILCSAIIIVTGVASFIITHQNIVLCAYV
jgi:hypothetical protein